MSTSSGKSGSKLVLKQLDHGVKEQDLLNVYPDTHIRPKIVVSNLNILIYYLLEQFVIHCE